MKPVAFIDLFCGMGGFTVGGINAGARCILAVDYWVMKGYRIDEACRVHLANHPKVPVECIELGHPDQWRRFKALVDEWRARGYHIHIHGSPPCQALSNASQRDAAEGMPLVLWYLDLVERCEPDSWSMENVVPVRKRLPEGIPSVVLNSADFGVPQTRRRCYAGEGWIADPSHSKEEWVGVIDALPHLADELVGFAKPPSMENHWREMGVDEPFPTVTSQSVGQHKLKLLARYRSGGREPTTSDVSEPAHMVGQWTQRLLMDSGRASAATTGVNPRTGKKEGGSGPLFRTLDKPSYVTGAGPSDGRRARSGDKEISLPSHTVHNNPPSLRTVRLEALGSNAKRSADTTLDLPSKTVCGSGNQVGPRMFDHDLEKPQKIRSLTLPETMTLQGFDPFYDLSAARTMKSRWTMVGNAVPPPVAEAVIRGIQHGIHG